MKKYLTYYLFKAPLMILMLIPATMMAFLVILIIVLSWPFLEDMDDE